MPRCPGKLSLQTGGNGMFMSFVHLVMAVDGIAQSRVWSQIERHRHCRKLALVRNGESGSVVPDLCNRGQTHCNGTALLMAVNCCSRKMVEPMLVRLRWRCCSRTLAQCIVGECQYGSTEEGVYAALTLRRRIRAVAEADARKTMCWYEAPRPRGASTTHSPGLHICGLFSLLRVHSGTSAALPGSRDTGSAACT